LRKWLKKRKTHLAVEDVFPKTIFENLYFKAETLQEPQQGYSLIGEYHSEVIFGLTFPREEKK
jgi:hypothetical protein